MAPTIESATHPPFKEREATGPAAGAPPGHWRCCQTSLEGGGCGPQPTSFVGKIVRPMARLLKFPRSDHWRNPLALPDDQDPFLFICLQFHPHFPMTHSETGSPQNSLSKSGSTLMPRDSLSWTHKIKGESRQISCPILQSYNNRTANQHL